MNLSRRNISSDDLGGIVSVVRCDNRPFALDLRAVFLRHGSDEWRYVTGRCVEATDAFEQRHEMYRDFAFVAQSLGAQPISEFLSVLSGTGCELSAQVPPIKIKDQNVSWTEEIVPSHATGTGLPRRKYSARIDGDAYFSEGQLIAYGMPHYLSAGEYTREFLGLSQFHGASDGQKGELSIEVTDQRGAIGIDNDRLFIANAKEPLCLVGHLNSETPIKLMGDEEQVIDTQNLRDVELWLVSEGDEVIDYRSSTEWPYQYLSDRNHSRISERLEDLINGGESEICEFKVFVDLGDTHKFSEIERTVCAFANGRGGQLFIGVNDEGEVMGLAKDLVKKRGGNIEKAAADYAAAIRKQLLEGLRHNQCFAIEAVVLYGLTVVTLAVKRSPEPNYLLNSKQAYVRHGSTNMKMSPPELAARAQSVADGFYES